MPHEPHAWTRRAFMRSSFALSASFASVPTFLARTVHAAPPRDEIHSIPGISDERILVLLQLGGGNDGLNTIVPFQDDAYHRARPQLALSKGDLLPLTDSLGLHPGLRDLQALQDAGELAWILGAGYPNPNRSHFRSMEIWHSASDAGERVDSGWLGRYFDARCNGRAPIPANAAISLGTELPDALRTAAGGAAGIVLEDPDTYAWQPSGRTNSQSRRQRNILDESMMLQDPLKRESIDFLKRTALDASLSSELIAEAEKKYRRHADFPNHWLGRQFALIAKLIGGEVGSQAYFAHIGGFDTHADQPAAHQRLLEQIGSSIAAFREDLQRKDLWQNVVILAFSEFGRRVAENNSTGTDHGAGSVMFVAGQGVQGGVYGSMPSLTDLQHGDLKHSTDFRSVYGSVLDQWLGLRHHQILGRRFPGLDLFRT